MLLTQFALAVSFSYIAVVIIRSFFILMSSFDIDTDVINAIIEPRDLKNFRHGGIIYERT